MTPRHSSAPAPSLTAAAAVSTALLLLGPAAAHPNAGPVTDLLMWAVLMGGLLPAMTAWGRSRRAQSNRADQGRV
ncbi:hypothetical protein ACFP81_05380 [Deinococcus lacus]|uniref:Uncharacterized protein n=1 Tax=Deinococcus lacus TaxID=392561 RepID=A0ABW1YF48_9DEIO